MKKRNPTIIDGICCYPGRSSCSVGSSCYDCEFNPLICPNCGRNVPSDEHFLLEGCKWCINPTK
jgi:hypothetical protein